MRRTVLFAGDADLVMSGLARPPQENRDVFCELFAEAAISTYQV